MKPSPSHAAVACEVFGSEVHIELRDFPDTRFGIEYVAHGTNGAPRGVATQGQLRGGGAVERDGRPAARALGDNVS